MGGTPSRKITLIGSIVPRASDGTVQKRGEGSWTIMPIPGDRSFARRHTEGPVVAVSSLKKSASGKENPSAKVFERWIRQKFRNLAGDHRRLLPKWIVPKFPINAHGRARQSLAQADAVTGSKDGIQSAPDQQCRRQKARQIRGKIVKPQRLFADATPQPSRHCRRLPPCSGEERGIDRRRIREPLGEEDRVGIDRIL